MLNVAIIGYGNRGRLYGRFIKSKEDLFEVVAVVDELQSKLDIAKSDFNLSDNQLFKNDKDFFAKNINVDLLIIASMDRYHYQQAIDGINKGYNILLEKPISTSIKECLEIKRLANEKHVKIVVAHVLRYTMFYKKIKKIIESGEIGEIVNLNQTENVSYWHQAHSYVRGNWANSDVTGPMILTKCSHDLDIISWLIDKPVSKISSFGSLSHFKKENAPLNSSQYCKDCAVRKDCPFDAYRFYLNNGREWLRAIIGDDLSDNHINDFLDHNQYSRCVYKCNNNVVDHQIVNVLFKNGTTASLTMNAFSRYCYRDIHVFGTLGEIIANFEDRIIKVNIFNDKSYEIDINNLTDDFTGHGGGDNAMMLDFYNYITGKKFYNGLTTIDQSVLSHVLAFSAEDSRLDNGKVIDIEKIINK